MLTASKYLFNGRKEDDINRICRNLRIHSIIIAQGQLGVKGSLHFWNTYHLRSRCYPLLQGTKEMGTMMTYTYVTEPENNYKVKSKQ